MNHQVNLDLSLEFIGIHTHTLIGHNLIIGYHLHLDLMYIHTHNNQNLNHITVHVDDKNIKMKYDKPFHIKLTPDYSIEEPINEVEANLKSQSTLDLGGFNFNDHQPQFDNAKILSTGGRMDWSLFQEPNSNNPIINVQLMRLWSIQMVSQMVNGKAHTDQVDSKVEITITNEEIEIMKNIAFKLNQSIHNEIKEIEASLVPKRKLKKIDL